MTDQKTILTEEQVAEIDRDGWSVLTNNSVSWICASHEALRARVAELERALRDVITIRVDENSVPKSKTWVEIDEIVRSALANSTKPNNDAEIARLAREYVRVGSERSYDALIAAVGKEGK